MESNDQVPESTPKFDEDDLIDRLQGKKIVVLFNLTIPGCGSRELGTQLEKVFSDKYPDHSLIGVDNSKFHLEDKDPETYKTALEELLENHLQKAAASVKKVTFWKFWKSYAYKNARKDAEIIREYLADKVPVKIYLMTPQVISPQQHLVVKEEQYTNKYPFSHGFLALCLKRALNRDKKSEGEANKINYCKSLCNLISTHRNEQFSELYVTSQLGLDGVCNFDYSTKAQEKAWVESADQHKLLFETLASLIRCVEKVPDESFEKFLELYNTFECDEEVTTVDREKGEFKYSEDYIKRVDKLVKELLSDLHLEHQWKINTVPVRSKNHHHKPHFQRKKQDDDDDDGYFETKLKGAKGTGASHYNQNQTHKYGGYSHNQQNEAPPTLLGRRQFKKME